MPNWCNNRLTLTHTDPAQIDRAVRAFKEGHFLAEFIPVPQELRDTVASPGTSDEELVAQRNANVEKYGYPDWWAFCVNEWGTKWDIGGGGDGDGGNSDGDGDGDGNGDNNNQTTIN